MNIIYISHIYTWTDGLYEHKSIHNCEYMNRLMYTYEHKPSVFVISNCYEYYL
jgi:hypothetical protein